MLALRLDHKFSFSNISARFINLIRFICGLLVVLKDSECNSWSSCGYPYKTFQTTTFRNCQPAQLLITTPTPTKSIQIHSGEIRITATKGETVSFPCQVINIGENQIIWRHGENILTGSNISSSQISQHWSKRLELLPDFTLRILHVSSEDNGDYECIVTTSWPRLKLTHHLHVLDPPTLNIEPDTGSITVTEGDSVRVGCIPEGNPIPHITWTKKLNIPIDKSRSYVGKDSLTIYSVTASDTGLYECRAENGVGRAAVGNIYIRVRHMPDVKAPQRIIHGGVNYRAELLCTVDSDPISEVQWIFKQRPVYISERILRRQKKSNSSSFSQNHFLIFNPVIESDFGVYICMANNTLGYDLKYIELSGVPNPPVLTRWDTSSCISNEFSSQNGQCRVNVSLFWAVESYSPLIDYTLIFRMEENESPIDSFNEDKVREWTEVKIPSDSTFSFIHSKSFLVHELLSGESYEGALRARNKYGTSHLSSVFYFTTHPSSSNRVLEAMKFLNPSQTSDKGIYENILVEGEKKSPPEDYNFSSAANKPKCAIQIYFIIIPSIIRTIL